MDTVSQIILSAQLDDIKNVFFAFDIGIGGNLNYFLRAAMIVVICVAIVAGYIGFRWRRRFLHKGGIIIRVLSHGCHRRFPEPGGVSTEDEQIVS